MTTSPNAMIAACLREVKNLLKPYRLSFNGALLYDAISKRAAELEASAPAPTPAEPQYRSLLAGELVEAGDEVRGVGWNVEWHVLRSVINPNQCWCNEYRTRRPLPAPSRPVPDAPALSDEDWIADQVKGLLSGEYSGPSETSLRGSLRMALLRGKGARP